jgi:hypothetical protein
MSLDWWEEKLMIGIYVSRLLTMHKSSITSIPLPRTHAAVYAVVWIELVLQAIDPEGWTLQKLTPARHGGVQGSIAMQAGDRMTVNEMFKMINMNYADRLQEAVNYLKITEEELVTLARDRGQTVPELVDMAEALSKAERKNSRDRNARSSQSSSNRGEAPQEKVSPTPVFRQDGRISLVGRQEEDPEYVPASESETHAGDDRSQPSHKYGESMQSSSHEFGDVEEAAAAAFRFADSESPEKDSPVPTFSSNLQGTPEDDIVIDSSQRIENSSSQDTSQRAERGQ